MIHKDMLLWDIIILNRGAMDIFKRHGMECLTCNGIHSETLEVAARANRINLDEILNELNNLEKKSLLKSL